MHGPFVGQPGCPFCNPNKTVPELNRMTHEHLTSNYLLACPFCGGTPRMATEYDPDGVKWHYITCPQCGARIRGQWHSPGNDCPLLRAEVRDQWNRRASVEPGEAQSLRDGAAQPPSDAARDVLAERERQKSVEGWTPEHDDEHNDEQLALAAACYALGSPTFWPWENRWWKPKDRRRNLVRAGALILAEIERIDRAAQAKSAQPKLCGNPLPGKRGPCVMPDGHEGNCDDILW